MRIYIFVGFLENKGITTRLVFAGNLTKQPAFKEVNFRTIGNLTNTDLVMKNTLFVGVYPGINTAKFEYMTSTINEFLEKL